VVVPARALPEARLTAQVTLQSYGLSGSKTRVAVKDGAKVLATQDVVLKGELPLGITAAADFYAACISGAVQKEEYLQMLSRAGFTDIRVTQEKPLQLSDADILCYASREDLADFRARGTSVLSITVRGEKPQVLA
jgi:hypothetical protein